MFFLKFQVYHIILFLFPAFLNYCKLGFKLDENPYTLSSLSCRYFTMSKIIKSKIKPKKSFKEFKKLTNDNLLDIYTSIELKSMLDSIVNKTPYVNYNKYSYNYNIDNNEYKKTVLNKIVRLLY